MQDLSEVKKLIEEAKNIYLIPAQNHKEAIPTALALFYTLKQLDKNVNIIIENFPEKFKFLIFRLYILSKKFCNFCPKFCSRSFANLL